MQAFSGDSLSATIAIRGDGKMIRAPEVIRHAASDLYDHRGVVRHCVRRFCRLPRAAAFFQRRLLDHPLESSDTEIVFVVRGHSIGVHSESATALASDNTSAIQGKAGPS